MSKKPASALGYKTAIKVINAISFLHAGVMLVALAVNPFTQIFFKLQKVLIVVQVNNPKLTFEKIICKNNLNTFENS